MAEQAGQLNKIKVLIVDDSAIIRKLYTQFIESDPELVLVGAAPNPFFARDLLVDKKPDVMILDIEMPKMDGISFLEKVMQHMPTRTLICSSLSAKGSEMALRAFEAGAVDVMEKPALDVEANLNALAKEFITRLKIVAKAKMVKPLVGLKPAVKAPAQMTSLGKTTHQILAIASSTGGTEALKVVLANLPPDIPGTVIVQHMPPGFTKNYAEALNRICPFEVREAKEGDRVLPGLALLAPGNFHMELRREGGFYFVTLHQQPPMHGVRPAADFLMKTVAQVAAKNSVGVVLTGMGRDGAAGLLEMRQAGSYNIAQDEASCVVFGMPKEAINIGAIDKVLPLDKIAAEIIAKLKSKN